MAVFAPSPRRLIPTGPLQAAILLSVCFLPGLIPANAAASLRDPFSGVADVSAVQGEVDGIDEDTFRQEYNIHFDHALAPWVDLRLGFRYYKFDQDIGVLMGAYREEVQPTGEIRWDHPLFSFSTSAFRRQVLTSAQGKIFTENVTGSIQSRDRRYPLVEIRYDQQHTWAPDLDDDYDVRNRRWQANADYDAGDHRFGYGFSRFRGENVISNQTSHVTRHLARWTGTGRPGSEGRWILSGRYNFNYSQTTNERRDTLPVLEIASISQGLYALDADPDLGELDSLEDLADGNRNDPVFPRIDIGSGNVDHNLGADLGLIERVAGMYIYTDRPSGDEVRWEMYGSDDNLTWSQIPVYAGQLFNPGLNRYEVTCPPVEYRYVKAVNTGLNQIAQVFVTEIEVLRELPQGVDETRFFSASHSLDGRASYRINDRWDTSLDGSYQYDEVVGSPDDRSRWGLGWRLVYDPSPKVTHQLRWDVGEENGIARGPSTLNNSVGYTLVAYPMETLRGTFSLRDRMTYLDGDRSQRVLGTAAEANAALLPTLAVKAGGGVSWFDDYVVEQAYDTWYVRTGMDAGLRKSLGFQVEHTYQETREDGVEGLRTRQYTTLGLDWRVTRSIYCKGTLRRTTQRTSRWNRELILSWNLSRRIRVSGQLYEITDEDVTTNLRKSVVLNWDLSSRSNIYLRLAELDLSGGGGSRTVSFQQGIRVGF